jgi:septum formation protein
VTIEPGGMRSGLGEAADPAACRVGLRSAVGAPRLVLASSSPRRRELMTEAGYRFEVVLPDENAECGICSRETPPELVARLAYQKAESVARQVSGRIVIACDTVAECQGTILGKPVDRRHARQMLQLLRGREHRVYSGLCLWPVGLAPRVADQPHVKVAVSSLRMDPIDDRLLEAYLDSEQWVGKSGAFGFQDGPSWLQLCSGSASNVVGLPMELLVELLDELGLSQVEQHPAVDS